jgi:hypothetical protein
LVKIVRVLTAEDCGPRRTAEREAYEIVLQRRALFGQERLQPRHPVEQPGVEIVGQDEDDVGTLGSLNDGRATDWRFAERHRAEDEQHQQQ